MGNFEQIFGDYLAGYKSTSQYKDNLKMEIILSKSKYEKNLDEMWGIYSKGNPQQIVEYNKGVAQIKECGLKVLRNSKGKHKIVVPQAR